MRLRHEDGDYCHVERPLLFRKTYRDIRRTSGNLAGYLKMFKKSLRQGDVKIKSWQEYNSLALRNNIRKHLKNSPRQLRELSFLIARIGFIDFPTVVGNIADCSRKIDETALCDWRSGNLQLTKWHFAIVKKGALRLFFLKYPLFFEVFLVFLSFFRNFVRICRLSLYKGSLGD